MEKIVFPIGDWSFDGHAFLAEFIVRSSFSLDKVREIHFIENHFLGSLCSEYEQHTLDVHQLFAFIKKYSKNADFDFLRILTNLNEDVQYEDFLGNEIPNPQNKEIPQLIFEKISLTFEEDEIEGEGEILMDMSISNGKAMLILWLEFLMLIEQNQPSHNPLSPLSFEILGEPIGYRDNLPKDIPSIHFYGVNSQGLHLKTPGYGVWTCDEMDFYYPVN